MKYLIVWLAALFALPVRAAAFDFQRWQTPQGSDVLLIERHNLPMVDVAVFFKGAGSTADPEGRSLIAAATLEMLGRGTQDADEEAFNRALAELGAKIGRSENFEYSMLALRSLSDSVRLNAAAEWFGQAVSRPYFDAAVLQRIKDQAVLTLQQNESDPDFVAQRELTRLSYGTHPYGKAAWSNADAVQAVGVADLYAFHRAHYTQGNAVVVMVGDINRAAAERLVHTVLQGLPIQHSADTATPPVPRRAAQHAYLPFADKQQTVIRLGLPLLKSNDPDYFALLLGNHILGGGGFDSRLMKSLRDRYGYTYGAASNLTAHREAGLFHIGFTTANENRDAALAETRRILADFIANGPTEAELKQAKANITGSFARHFDTNHKLLANLAGIALYQRPDDWLTRFPERINALSSEDVRQAWQKRLKMDNIHTVVVGGSESQ